MATFQRWGGQEEKFRHDEATGFKIKVRRNKLLGLWAADTMGLSGDDAEAYAKEVVAADFQKPGDDDVVEKIVGDLKNKGLDIAEAQIRQSMSRFAAEAQLQVVGR